MRIQKFFFLFLLGIICSCSDRKEHNEYLMYADYLVDTVTLKLDNYTSNEFYYIHYTHDSLGQYLVALNPFTSSVDKYSLTTGDMVKRIKFKTEGPEGITGVLQGITYHNPDSIFLFLRGRLQGGIIIDERGEFVDRIKPNIDGINSKIEFNHVSTGGNPTYLVGNKLHFMRYPLFDTYNPSNINGNYPIALTYNLQDQHLQFDSLITFPSFYQDKIWAISDIIFSRAIGEDGMYVLSWPLLDHLIVYDKKDGSVLDVPAKSQFKGKPAAPFSMPPSDALENEEVLSSLRYRNVLSDPYRNLYYRIVHLPLSNYEGKDYLAGRAEQDFSVLVLDKDFNLLREVFFPGKTFSSGNARVVEKGLILMKNNILYEGLQEDFVSLETYDLSK